MIEVIGNSNKVVRHLHVPLQSGSDSVLKRMRRKYTMEHFSERLTELHKALPDLAVTSDVIVGFLVRLKKNSKKLTTSSSNINFLNYTYSLILRELVRPQLEWMTKLMKELK